MLVLYTNVCTPCRYRTQMNTLRQIAKARHTDIKVLETRYNPEWLAEARKLSGLPLPFVWDTDRGIGVEVKDLKIEWAI